MRLRAKVVNIQLFIKLVQTVEKIGKTCVILLSEPKVQFILTSETTDGMQVWSGINSQSLFDNYRIESIHHNRIAFEVSLENLVRALKSAQYATETILKLTKKNGLPFLSLEIEIAGSQVMSIVQDVPIQLFSAAQIDLFNEPSLPDPLVHIMMPPLRLLRNVVDRMKNISEFLTIHGTMGGKLTLQVTTDIVVISTTYANLDHPQIAGRDPPAHDDSIRAEVKVDIKKFAKFLYSYQVSPTNVICCIVVNRALVLHVLMDDLYITYYVPVVVNS